MKRGNRNGTAAAAVAIHGCSIGVLWKCLVVW